MREGNGKLTKSYLRDFPGCPVVKNLHFHCREHGFDSRLGNLDPAHHSRCGQNKQTNKQKKNPTKRKLFSHLHNSLEKLHVIEGKKSSILQTIEACGFSAEECSLNF